MPMSFDGFDVPTRLIEYRGIRAGEKGEKAPIRLPLTVRFTHRNAAKKLEIDEAVMRAAARRLGIDEDLWASVRQVPVYLYTDAILGDRGVVFLERALYSGRGRLCGSVAGHPKAAQLVDPEAYLRGDKNLPVRDKPREVDCTPQCPLWLSPEDRAKGKKSDCNWRAIVTVQLMDSPVFPSPTRMRTHSLYSIDALLTSLRAIAQVTGGVLMGIPLWLRQSNLDIRDATGEFRRIPVTNFDFRGTIQGLRQHAVRELESRKSLIDGKPMTVPMVSGDEDENEVVEEELLLPPSATDDLQKASHRLDDLCQRLNITPARRQLMEKAHEGDIDAVITELLAVLPPSVAMGEEKKFDPSPGAPAAAVDTDLFD